MKDLQIDDEDEDWLYKMFGAPLLNKLILAISQ